VIYGNIARFYSPERLAHFDVVSTRPERLSGHFAVLRNTAALRRAFERIPHYQAQLEWQDHVGVDESAFSEIILRSGSERLLFVERYSTVLSARGWHNGTLSYPQRWFWKRGHLTNDQDWDRQFLYLHFMRWQSDRWINNPPLAGEGAWIGKDIIKIDWRRASVEGFCISPEGFTHTTDDALPRQASASQPPPWT
jgi:hypothetical protein